jgi:hypothetical protein
MEPFDYLNSNLSARFGGEMRTRSVEEFEREIRERARLLFNLKYKAADAAARIRQNVAWEFDDAWTKALPDFATRIDDIVAAVYKHVEGKKD